MFVGFPHNPFLKAQSVNNLPAMLETRVWFLGWEDPLEKEMATHSILAWRIPWTEETGRLQSMGSLRVGHDWLTSLSLFTFMIGDGNGNPLQYSCLENPRARGACWAAFYGVTQSQTWLKRLSSSGSNTLIFFLYKINQNFQHIYSRSFAKIDMQTILQYFKPTPVLLLGKSMSRRVW